MVYVSSTKNLQQFLMRRQKVLYLLLLLGRKMLKVKGHLKFISQPPELLLTLWLRLDLDLQIFRFQLQTA